MKEQYEATAKAMLIAGQQWAKEHPDAALVFVSLDEQTMYIAPLSERIIEWFALNDDARAFLRALNHASEGKATLTLARFVISTLMDLKYEGGADA